MSSRVRRLVPLAVLAVLAMVFAPGAGSAGASSNVNHVIHANFAGVDYAASGLPPVSGKTIRLWDDGTNWCNLEPSRGTFATGPLHTLVHQLRAAGYTQIILVLGMTPKWASAHGPNGQGRGDICSDQTAYTTTMPRTGAWVGFVSHIAKQFKGKITAYEVWNEPSDPQFWNGGVKNMSQLTSLAHKAIKHIDPAARVLSASLPAWSHSWNKRYVAQIAHDGWHVDGITFHSYSGLHCTDGAHCTSSQLSAMLRDHINHIQAIKHDIAAARPPRAIPLWETEVNHNFDGKTLVTVSQRAQTRLVARTFMDDLRFGVNREVWYAFNRAFGVSMADTGDGYLTLRTMQSWTAKHVFKGCAHSKVSGVAVTRCHLDSRETAWAGRGVKVPGLDGRRCSLPDGACSHATSVRLTPTPKLIIHG